jgi:hypothetical protein
MQVHFPTWILKRTSLWLLDNGPVIRRTAVLEAFQESFLWQERNQVFPCCKSILCWTLTKLQKDFNCTAYTLYMWKYLYNVTIRTSLSMARASIDVCLQLCAIYAAQFTLIISLWSFQSTVCIVHTSHFSPPFVLQLSARNPIKFVLRFMLFYDQH